MPTTVPSPDAVPIPEPLKLRHRQSKDGRAWLHRLPNLIKQSLGEWNLSVDLPIGATPWHGHTGIVIPVLDDNGVKLALKVAYPHDEVLLEPTALKLWGGHGAVPLLHSDASLGAILIERLDDKCSLLELSMEDAVPLWGAVVRELSIHPDNRPGWRELPRIAETAERFCDELPQRWSDLSEPFPRWLLETALEVCQIRGAVSLRSSGTEVLVHTDLHYMNVLAHPTTGKYLAIDPQAQVGDAEFTVAPCLWNRLRALPTINTEAALRRRSSALAAAAGLDTELAAQWSVVREVDNALNYLEDGASEDAVRSLWVASTMAGSTLAGLPDAHQLKQLV